MLHFLRRIRRSLINSGNARKYLLYAVGEILLVMIGILLALQVNNWNEDRKKQQLEIKVLAEMQSNLKRDSSDIMEDIGISSSHKHSIQTVLNCIGNNLPYNDSLDFHFGNLFGSSWVLANTSAYENLKSIGISLISDDNLRQKITLLYSENYKISERLVDVDSRVQFDHLMPQLLKKVKREKYNNRGQPVSFEKLRMDHEFQETLKVTIEFHDYAIKRYEKIIIIINDLLKHIERYINNT